MTSVFDGLTGVLNAVFGAPVSVLPVGGPAVTVQGVFREIPVDDEIADGRPGFTVTPVLRVQRAVSATLSKGALVILGDGRRFRLLRPVHDGSPAADAFITWALEAD